MQCWNDQHEPKSHGLGGREVGAVLWLCWVRCQELPSSSSSLILMEIEKMLRTMQYLHLLRIMHVQAGVQGLFQRQCCCKTVNGFPEVMIPRLELSPDHQPVLSPRSAAPEPLSGALGRTWRDSGELLWCYGPGAHGKMCPLFLGTEVSKGAHKNKCV